MIPLRDQGGLSHAEKGFPMSEGPGSTSSAALSPLLVGADRCARDLRSPLIPGVEPILITRSFAFDRLDSAAAVLDGSGTIIDTNAAWRLFANLNHGSSSTTGVGVNYLEACDVAAASGDADARAAAEGLRDILSGEREHFDLEYPCPAPNEERWFRLQAAAAPVANGAGAVVLHVDITAFKVMTDRLRALADEDPLTGLPNRRAALAFIDEHLATIRTRGGRVSVLFFDLDGFKAVNDEHGHHAGDELLVKVATRGRHVLRARDQLCRLGGDEFVVVCPDLRDLDTGPLVARLREAMTGPFQVGPRQVSIGVSVGCAVSDATSTSTSLLAAADTAMYAEKRSHAAKRLRAPAEGLDAWTPGGAITGHTPARAVRRAAETRFEIGFEQSAVGAVISDLEGCPIRVNAAVCSFLGRPVTELVRQRWTRMTHPDELPLGHQVTEAIAAGRDTYEDERRYLRPDGTVVWGFAHVTLVRADDGEPLYFFMQLQDITARKQMELDLAYQALHDPLTGLANRTLLNDWLIDGLVRSRRLGFQLQVIFVDLDQFKVVNDSLGHGAGDELLRHAAARISGALHPNDTVARFGGDEFVVVCDGLSPHAEEAAERIRQVLSEPWQLGNEELHITASLGIAVADATSSPDSMLRDADAALRRAKELGRGSIVVFDDALRHQADRRLAVTSALHGALERGEFVLHYQPIIDIVSGRLTGAESLLRWTHPQHGPISPDEFIPLAEENGLIVPIGTWVLEQACEQLATWQRMSLAASDLSIAVNLSVRQLRAHDIVDVVERVLRETGVCPAHLCLELTESVLMNDVEYFQATIGRLHDLGVHLAIDDFGTGYSSLGYLSRFSIDTVKIDRSFVSLLGANSNDNSLTAVIVAMAGARNLHVVAEGIETHEQLRILRGLGVRLGQGFLFSRPVPAAEFTELVGSGHIWAVDESDPSSVPSSRQPR